MAAGPLMISPTGEEVMKNRRRGVVLRGVKPDELAFPTSLCPCSRKVVVAERGVVEGAWKRVNQTPVFSFSDLRTRREDHDSHGLMSKQVF